jgi:hypothetical protein
VSIALILNQSEISVAIQNATRSSINAALHNCANAVKRDIQTLIASVFASTPEYNSLLNGILKEVFALEDANIPLKDITGAIQQSVVVSVIPVATVGKTLNGGLVITFVKSNFQDILGLSSGSYQKGQLNVPWLEWLLTEGDRVILANYPVQYNLKKEDRNRLSGVAVMEKGGGWRIPTQFAGTLEDNWITRAFDSSKIAPLIDGIVEKNLSRYLR